MRHGVLPHDTQHTRGMTGQAVYADKTIVIFTRAGVQFVTAAWSKLNAFFAGGAGTITEEKGYANI